MELLEPVTRSSPNVTIANIRQILKKNSGERHAIHHDSFTIRVLAFNEPMPASTLLRLLSATQLTWQRFLSG